MSEALLRHYLRKIEKVYQAGNATEYTYRSVLQELIEIIFPGITATNEPKRIKCGAPDFIITNKHIPLGYIETKDIGVALDQIERTGQMKRYLGSLANLILTDYLEFRWYVAGQLRMSARLAKVGANHKLIAENGGIATLTDLLQGFMLTHTPTVSHPKELALRMAALAQLIRNAIRLAFESEEGGESLHTQMEGFKQVLLPDLTYEQFADMYAQTICYGLFAARCNAKPGIIFTREHAAYDIPKTNPFLRKMFGYIAGPELDERIVWVVDDLAELLNRSDMAAILQDFGKRTRQEDPVVHFYETFLAEYDPKMREARGVYYTPEPVVSYIVRSVDYLLKKDFELAEGLADRTKLKAGSSDGKYSMETHLVQILDPATGTGTFLHSVIDLIYEQFQHNRGMWSSYVSQHLLKRVFGFELLMAPYAVAHMKLGLQLAETGYDFRSNERLGIYLTNTLEEGFEGGKLPFVEWLVEEATAAGNIKYDAPVMVIVGNPPYSGHSANKGTWITELLHDKGGNYFEVDGKPLGERNPKWLNNDYVKFMRFAQWRIERTGYGILAFITDNSYLGSPTFRGMRQSLMHTFDEIYILDLHGNSKKKERSPDGTKDENVFDITQGVAIGIFVKRQTSTASFATVYHAHLYGPREVYQRAGQEQYLINGKYHWLETHTIKTTEWKRANPLTPYYLFTPEEGDVKGEYEQGYKVTDIFGTGNPKADGGKKYGLGICTHNDLLHIGWTETELMNRVQRLASETIPDSAILETFPVVESPYWNTARERAKIRKSQWQEKIWTVYYRPFDWRKIYYEPDLMDIGRGGSSRHVMNHARFCSHNLMISKGYEIEAFQHVLVANAVAVHHAATRKEGNYLFPLYLYHDPNELTLFDTNEHSTAPDRRSPNLSEVFIKSMEDKLGIRFVSDGKGNLHETFGPEDVFDYIYAILHSPTYRSRYAEFLKIDFPRLPLTSNANLFRELCEIGDQLVALHLMEKFGNAKPSYPIDGDHLVEKVEYVASPSQPDYGRVYINKKQYFEGVPQDVWDFHIGGYQVCQKWFKDRKGRTLSYEDIEHFQRIVGALAETILLMDKVDELIEERGGWPIE